MAYDVQFKKGTAAAYAEIASKDSLTFYYTTDSHDLYLGEVKLSNASDLASAVSRIGVNESAISGIQTALETINGDASVSGSIRNLAAAAVTVLDNQLAAVAKSGEAEDVSIDDTAGYFTSDDVEGALAELGLAMTTAGAVTISDSTTSQGMLKTYTITQNGQTIGTIDIPKDIFPADLEIVNQDGEGNPGTFIKMTVQNGSPIYLDVADLIEYNDVSSTTEIILSNANHTISATIGEVSGSKLTAGSVAESKLDSSVQGKLALASSAVQSVTESDATTGTNGTITVDGTEVAVKGLGSAAFTASTAYDAAGTGAAQAAAVLGESTDQASANTVFGAKAAAGAAASQASTNASAITALEGLVGSTAVSTQISDAIGALDVTDTAITGSYVSAVSQTDGAITVSRQSLPDYSLVYDGYGQAATAEANAKAYTDTALTWASF